MESKPLLISWDSHISPENETWLAENVEGFEQSVKEILKLIEQDGVFSGETAEVFDNKKPELETQIAELTHKHKVLADRYDHLIGEVRKNCSSPTKTQHLDISDSSSPPQISQMLTPDYMTSVHKFRTPIGFDVLLSPGGGGSYASKREGSDSSFLLSSDSDSESFGSMNKLLVSPVNNGASKVKETKGPETFLKKIADLEEELASLNTRLANLEDENLSLKTELIEKEKSTEMASNLQSLLEAAQRDMNTRNNDLETEKAKVAEIKAAVCDSSSKIEKTKEELEACKEKLVTAEDEISKLKHALSSMISEEKVLQGQLESEKVKISEMEEEISLYMADISVRDDHIRELKTELIEKCHSIDDLNKKFDAFKQKHDALMSEKDGLVAQLDTLRAETRSQGISKRELETRLNALQADHIGVLSSFGSSQKLANELRVRVEELEREVDYQRKVISERAEEKREAIRQLCFSLEHYRSGYKELREAFIGHKGHARAVFAV